jgi:hypothetical protein
MKTTNPFFMVITAVLLLCNNINALAQEEAKVAQYYTITTMHWNMDYKDFDMDTWKAVEKEFLDKVAMKNEYLMASSVYLHHTTPDNRELLYVQVFDSWDAIDKAAERSDELAKEAWSDDNERKAYFKKRNAYYSNFHSDEIYSAMSGAKVLQEPTKDMIMYFRTSHFAFPEDGTLEEFKTLRSEFTENVIHKNEFIKGYYPGAHAYGADRTEFVEAFFFDSEADFNKMFDRNDELRKEAWPDEEVRKERWEKAGKYFTGVHGDAVYSMVYGLSK